MNETITQYLKRLARQPDGMVLYLCSGACWIGLALTQAGIIVDDNARKATLFALSPLLLLVLHARLEQLPLATAPTAQRDVQSSLPA